MSASTTPTPAHLHSFSSGARSPSPAFNNAQDTQISVNDLSTTSSYSSLNDKYSYDGKTFSLPSKDHPTSSPSPSPPPSPSPLFAFDELDTGNARNDGDTDEPENCVILENIAAVRRFKLHPSLLSDKPVRVSLFTQDVGIDGVKDVTELLWVCRGPILLDLGSNEITDKAIEVLAHGLHTPTCKVQVLLLQGNLFAENGAAILGSLLARSKFLLELNLRLNLIGDIGASALSNGLKRNRTLTKLNLSTNSISSDGAIALAEALAHNSSLKELDLSGNDIQDEGTVALVAALKSSKVAVLRMGCAGIGARGASALAELLPFSHLVSLYIPDNQIGDEGAIIIANSMHVNFSLRRLDVSGNQIGDQGAFAFAHALTMNKSFAHFSIQNNAVSPPGLLAVATALLNQPNLFCYNLSDNNVNPVEYRHIITMLEESWKAQHSNHFDEFTKDPSTEIPSLHSYLTSPHLANFLPPSLPSLPSLPSSLSDALLPPRFLPSTSTFSSPYHTTSIYPSPSPLQPSPSPLQPSPAPSPSPAPPRLIIPSTPSRTPSSAPSYPITPSSYTPTFYTPSSHAPSPFPSTPISAIEVDRKEEKKEEKPDPSKDIEDRLKNAIDTMKSRVAMRNDTFAQLQRARANSVPKRRRSKQNLHDPDEDEAHREDGAEEREREREEREEGGREEREREEDVVVGVEVEGEDRGEARGERERYEETYQEEEDSRATDHNSSLGSYSGSSENSAKTPKWIQGDSKPFILKRHSMATGSSHYDDTRSSRPLYTPPPATPPLSRTPPPPSRAAPPPPTLDPSPSSLPPALAASLAYVASNSSLASYSTPPSPRSDLSEGLTRPDSNRRRKTTWFTMPNLSRRKKTASLANSAQVVPHALAHSAQISRLAFLKQPAQVVPHGPPLPQITNEDVTTIRHWFINLPPPFPITRHRDKKTSHGTIILDREQLKLVLKRKFGGTKTYKTKLSPDVKGEITMLFPGAFTLTSPDFKKEFVLSSPQRELILSTLIVFIYGASTLLRNR